MSFSSPPTSAALPLHRAPRPSSCSSPSASMLLGKRSRIIRRTTSMSHLHPRPPPAHKSASAPAARPPPPSIPPIDDDSMLDSSADCDMLQNGVSMMSIEDSSDAQQSMAIDTVIASPSDRSSDSQAGHWPPHAIPGFPASTLGSSASAGHARPEAAESIRPGHFLDVCFFCDRLLQGRDIFMYRGDRAFCSIECRHHQIAADERREKCAVTAVKKGGTTPSVNPTSSKQAVPAETAAAA